MKGTTEVWKQNVSCSPVVSAVYGNEYRVNYNLCYSSMTWKTWFISDIDGQQSDWFRIVVYALSFTPDAEPGQKA